MPQRDPIAELDERIKSEHEARIVICRTLDEYVKTQKGILVKAILQRESPYDIRLYVANIQALNSAKEILGC
jgi:hypothetical protein